ncbi:MAG: thioredoxin [Spirochaetales bacterium]|nr:thioredoxin [Spirochaetales bacterium]
MIVEITVTDDNFNDEVINSELPVLVDFWAPWCMPCRMIAPIVEEISKDYEGQLKVCKMNVDDAPGISSEYRIGSIPTLSIFKNGEMVDQVVGAVPKDMLEAKIKEYL